MIIQKEDCVHVGVEDSVSEILSVPDTVEAALHAEVEDEASDDSVSARESSDRVTGDELHPGSRLREPVVKDIIIRQGTSRHNINLHTIIHHIFHAPSCHDTVTLPVIYAGLAWLGAGVAGTH